MRRAARIVCIVGLVTLIGVAIAAQLWSLHVDTPKGCFSVDPLGILYLSYEFSDPAVVTVDRVSRWSPYNLIFAPDWRIGVGVIQTPWWLLIASWGIVTAIVFRITRLRKVAHSFPVEPTIKPQIDTPL